MSDTLTAAWPWWQRAAAGIGVSLLVGGAIGVIVRLLMRAVVLLVDHEPSFSLPASVAIVLLFAVGVTPVACSWRSACAGRACSSSR